MIASDGTRAKARLPNGVESVAAWEAQLDQTIESCRRIAWRRLSPDSAARLLMALSFAVENCGIASVEHRMRTLSELVHGKIDRWKSFAEAQATDGLGAS